MSRRCCGVRRELPVMLHMCLAAMTRHPPWASARSRLTTYRTSANQHCHRSIAATAVLLQQLGFPQLQFSPHDFSHVIVLSPRFNPDIAAAAQADIACTNTDSLCHRSLWNSNHFISHAACFLLFSWLICPILQQRTSRSFVQTRSPPRPLF
jgi:hypothetical protein